MPLMLLIIISVTFLNSSEPNMKAGERNMVQEKTKSIYLNLYVKANVDN